MSIEVIDLVDLAHKEKRRKNVFNTPVFMPGCTTMRIPIKSAPIPKQIGMQSEQIGNPRSRSEATLGFCS
jgi:hypothetical protein